MSQRGKGGCCGQEMVDDAVEYSENLAQVVAPRRPHERPEEQEEVGHGGGRDEHLQALRRRGTNVVDVSEGSKRNTGSLP